MGQIFDTSDIPAAAVFPYGKWMSVNSDRSGYEASIKASGASISYPKYMDVIPRTHWHHLIDIGKDSGVNEYARCGIIGVTSASTSWGAQVAIEGASSVTLGSGLGGSGGIGDILPFQFDPTKALVLANNEVVSRVNFPATGSAAPTKDDSASLSSSLGAVDVSECRLFWASADNDDQFFAVNKDGSNLNIALMNFVSGVPTVQDDLTIAMGNSSSMKGIGYNLTGTKCHLLGRDDSADRWFQAEFTYDLGAGTLSSGSGASATSVSNTNVSTGERVAFAGTDREMFAFAGEDGSNSHFGGVFSSIASGIIATTTGLVLTSTVFPTGTNFSINSGAGFWLDPTVPSLGSGVINAKATPSGTGPGFYFSSRKQPFPANPGGRLFTGTYGNYMAVFLRDFGYEKAFVMDSNNSTAALVRLLDITAL